MKLNNITIIWLIAIGICFVAAWAWIAYLRNKGILNQKRRWVEALPSMISTLGVVGTFFGITMGLVNFDTGHLDASIPDLLDGLKTAFFTSLEGMLLSMILTRVVNASFDDEDKGVSDINQAASQIVQAVQQMSSETKQTMDLLRQQTEQNAQMQRIFFGEVTQLLNSINNDSMESRKDMATLLQNQEHTVTAISIANGRLDSIGVAIQNSANAMDNRLEGLGNTMTSIAGMSGNIEDKINDSHDVLVKTNKELGNVAYNLGELLDIQSSLVSTEEEINAIVKTFGQMLHGEVQEIEECMNNTNKLMEQKFDEFSELLKKSNTEALVEVMKKVTDEFQKQMNTLISKLIQENFDQLNKSVERLNQWQQDNKQMIESLTKQYKDMAVQFESTGTTLNKVGSDTKQLVSDGGKLNQLIASLNKVLIEDKNFIEISRRLESAVTLTQSNMTKFEASSRSLQEWVSKQRNFADSVNQLMIKLEELSNLRNYNEQFWKDTRKSMNEGVEIIKAGSAQLNQQLTRLDQQFYQRLSSTLAELDACIQAMVNGTTHRRS